MIHSRYYEELEKYERLISKKNKKSDFYNGIFDRYENPVLTRDHAPLTGNTTWTRKRTLILWSVSESMR